MLTLAYPDEKPLSPGLTKPAKEVAQESVFPEARNFKWGKTYIIDDLDFDLSCICATWIQ